MADEPGHRHREASLGGGTHNCDAGRALDCGIRVARCEAQLREPEHLQVRGSVADSHDEGVSPLAPSASARTRSPRALLAPRRDQVGLVVTLHRPQPALRVSRKGFSNARVGQGAAPAATVKTKHLTECWKAGSRSTSPPAVSMARSSCSALRVGRSKEASGPRRSG